jgi:hypothetical protein
MLASEAAAMLTVPVRIPATDGGEFEPWLAATAIHRTTLMLRRWRDAGFALEQGETRLATLPDDIRLPAREQGANIEEAMPAYLSWEIDLADQMATDDDQRFRILTSTAHQAESQGNPEHGRL